MRGSYPPSPSATVDAASDVAGLIYTGGTTGLSKGAMLTHHNVLSDVVQGAAWFPGLADGQEAVMCLIPFFHSYGMTVAMNLGIYKAAKLVLMPQFRLEPTLKVIQKERPALFPGIPPSLHRHQRGKGDRQVRPHLGDGLPVRGGAAAAGRGAEVPGHHRS